MDPCLGVAESILCSPGTITLSVSYTHIPMQNKKLKNFKTMSTNFIFLKKILPQRWKQAEQQFLLRISITMSTKLGDWSQYNEN